MNVPLGFPIRGVAAAPAADRGRFARIALTLRLALRDLRGGLRSFYMHMKHGIWRTILQEHISN
jgi:hypothetical protein